MSESSLDRVLQPRCVAVIGASTDPSKRGHQALRALLDAPFDGKVYATRPDGREVLGQGTYASVADLPEVPDLVYIATPAATVPDILEQCASRNVAGAVVPAVGFRESGETGAALERKIANVAAEAGIRVVGPNTSGLLNTQLKLNLVGMRDVPVGDLALLAQSGNIALDVANSATHWGVGLSVYVGVGNETDIGFHEYLSFLEHHSATRAIMMYVEGFREGRAFLDAASRITLKKPIVLLKGGRSEGGIAAARSHTGSIAGSYPVLRAALRQRGVSEVRRSDELLPVATSLARQVPVPAGLGIVVLSDGGGHGTLATDALADRGVVFAQVQDSTKTQLASLLGGAANVNNPVDVAGAADRDPLVFAKAIEILAADPAVGGILLVGLFGGYAIRFAESLAEQELEAAQRIATLMHEVGKPLIVHSLYADHMTSPLRHLIHAGFTVVESLDIGCRCMHAVHARGLYLVHEPVPAAKPEPRRTQPPGIVTARREGRSVLMETEARELLAVYDVPLSDSTFCRTAEDAARSIENAKGPVAFKIVSPSISHKTDAGGVILDIPDPDAGRDAFTQIVQNATRYALERGVVSDIRGVLVTRMLERPIAELIVGVKHDADFGPVLTVGAGGIAVEIHHDMSLRGLPVGRSEALQMLDEIRISRLLDGYRGRPPANRDALANVILGVAACALAHPEIEELEANPVFAYADRAVVVDARAFLTQLDSPIRQLGDASDDEKVVA